MKLVSSPCKNCTKRHYKCHVDCPEYLASKEETEKLKEWLNQEAEISAYASDVAKKKRKIWLWRNKK